MGREALAVLVVCLLTLAVVVILGPGFRQAFGGLLIATISAIFIPRVLKAVNRGGGD